MCDTVFSPSFLSFQISLLSGGNCGSPPPSLPVGGNQWVQSVWCVVQSVWCGRGVVVCVVCGGAGVVWGAVRVVQSVWCVVQSVWCVVEAHLHQNQKLIYYQT